VAPVPPTPSIIDVDASKVDRATAKTADDAAVDAYDQQVADFSEGLSTYHDAQTAYTQWCDEDAHVAAVLTASVLPRFVMTHKYRGCIVVLSINKSIEPNEEQKVLMSGFDQGITVNTSKQVFRGIW
jgi:hypothetical protein